MKRKYMTVLILVLAMFLTACQPGIVDTIPMENNANVPETTEPRNTIHPEGPVTTEPKNTQDAQVEKFQKLLYEGTVFDRGNWYLQALNCEYRAKEDMDLASLFYNGFPDESDEPTEAEIEYLNSTGRFITEWQCLDLIRLPVEKMDAVLQKYFGMTFEQANKESLDELVYWEETNCYYASHSDARGHTVVVTDVETVEYGRIAVSYYDLNSNEKYVLTVWKKGNGYGVVSNLMVLDGEKASAVKKTLNDVFRQEWYVNVLGAAFPSPEWVDLGKLFSDGIPGKSNELTEHEKEVLVKMGFNLNLDTEKMSADEMDAYLREYLGIGLDEVEINGFRNLVYLESTECWYRTGVFNGQPGFEASSIKTDCNGYYVVSYVTDTSKGVMEIKEKENGGYYILSNQNEYYHPES